MDNDAVTAGWDAVTDRFNTLYPGQDNPRHYGTLIPYQLGGKDPLDGTSIYDGGDFYHFVTYGFSELYEKETEEKEWSGYGFELTLKLKKAPLKDEENELRSVYGTLQSLARYVFENGNIFQPLEYIYTGQQEGMDYAQTSNITGFVTVLDDAGEIETKNGKVQFVQLVGMTDAELKAVQEKKINVEELLKKLGHTLTDYDRKSLL